MSLRNLIHKAITIYGHETPRLSFLPENRYNKQMFPDTGQYDWFSGQVLYCLIRHLHPRRILEISTSCGYATMFMALALKENNWGMVDTHEINPQASHAAQRLIMRYGLDRYVNFRIGDARETSLNSASDYGIYFLDSTHTESFLRWFIETHILPASRIDSLLHVHDILPRSARVRRWGNPPFPEALHSRGTGGKRPGHKWFAKSIARFFRRPALNDEEDFFEVKVYPPGPGQELETCDGNFTTEAALGNELVALMKQGNFVYLYDLAGEYPQLEPRKYDHDAVRRTDAQGQPMEWNESLWCHVTAMKDVYRKYSSMKENQKKQ